MKNDFAREYAQEQLNIRNYHEAEDSNDEAGMQAARDAHKAWSEAIDAKGQDYANPFAQKLPQDLLQPHHHWCSPDVCR